MHYGMTRHDNLTKKAIMSQVSGSRYAQLVIDSDAKDLNGMQESKPAKPWIELRIRNLDRNRKRGLMDILPFLQISLSWRPQASFSESPKSVSFSASRSPKVTFVSHPSILPSSYHQLSFTRLPRHQYLDVQAHEQPDTKQITMMR